MNRCKRFMALALAVVLVACVPGQAQETAAVPPAITAPVAASGDRITVNVVDQEIAALLRLIAESQRVNIIAGPEVTGTVTVNLYDVPFEEALAAILNVSGYTWYRVGSIIYVTTEEARGAMAPQVSDMQVQTFSLNHLEAKPLVEMLAPLLSKGGNAMEGMNRSLVVVDMPERLALVSKIIAEMDHPQRQVLIKVYIITVQRDNNLNIGTGFDSFPFDQYPPRPSPDTGEVDLREVPTGNGLFTGTLQKDFRAFVQALDSATDMEILASPQILVLDGETARLQVGDRLGFRITTTTETASLESVEFLEVGTVLEVRPTISADGLVQMQITPKVSSGLINNDGLPNESTTEVKTSMLVKDGQTVIIGGLLNATRQRVKSQVPFLGDLPLVGKLFGKTNWIDDESEVVVFLTPFITGPEPSPEMTEKIEDANQRWEKLEEQGIIDPETKVLKKSPTKRWRNLLQQRGAFPVHGAPEPETSEDAAPQP
ncbi:MAG: secretin and TonB N-terminal domain-containing protein [Candidatus Hydrogenedentes bacterium]|nr:secretin and TonB N-terminal domain-containing protein [Candidatus Hydrogenedentota bacterium]